MPARRRGNALALDRAFDSPSNVRNHSGGDHGAHRSSQVSPIVRRRARRHSGERPRAGLRADTTLHWLRLGDFVPASDTLLRRELVPEAEKALGLKITMETINGNDLQARITSAIQSGTGADLIHAMHNWPQLYAESLVDVSDVAEEIAKEQGGFYDIFAAIAKARRAGSRCRGARSASCCAIASPGSTRSASRKFPDTWESYRAAGKLLKAKGRPIGQTLGHAYNDAPAFTYPYLWSFGGKELEADGKTVALNSKETLESVKFMAGFWKDAHDEGGLAWDDSNNNRAFLGRHDLFDQQRCIDLYRGAAQARAIPHRKGHAAQGRHPARALSEGPGRRRGPASAADPHADGLFEEPEGRQGLLALGAARVRCSSDGSSRKRAFRFRRRANGRSMRCGTRTPSWRRSAT